MNEDIVYLADKAQSCLMSGQLKEARALYERLCHTDSRNEENWLKLAAVQGETGLLEEALSSTNHAIELDETYVEAYLGRANLLQKMGNLDEALNSALKAVEFDDEYGEAWLFLAGLAGQLDRYKDAEQWAQRAISLSPGDVDAYVNLANAQFRQGDPEAENSFRQVLQIQPENVAALLGVARLSIAQDRFEEAANQLQKVLQRAPGDSEALDSLGLCYMNLDRQDEAISIFENIIQSDAGYLHAYLHLAELLDRQGDYLGAIKWLEQAKNQTTFPQDVLMALISVYHSYGMHYRAIRICDEALELEPDNFDIRFYRTLSLADFNKYEEALAELKILESESPGNLKLVGTHASLLERMGDYNAAHDMILPHVEDQEAPGSIIDTYTRLCHRYNECDQATSLVEKMLARPGLNKDFRRGLLFTLIKLKDRQGLYDAAFACAREANELKPYQYNHAQYVKYVNRLLDPEITSLAAEPLTPTTLENVVRPVFIVGMPRSGTSLVEQIIATHPMVYGGGERHAISSIVSNLPSLLGNIAEYPECLSAVTPATIEQIRGNYARFTEGLPVDTTAMTDKMPENFQHAVLIRMLFPDSRIIHCVRNPIDTCLSCYFQQFTGYHDYAYDLEDLGKHYLEYQRLMKYYRDVAGVPMLEVKYEELVNDTEKVSRQMVEYCGLEWDERCLRFYESERVMRTASYDQVRQPVYTRSIDRWKNYEKHLGPLMDALNG